MISARYASNYSFQLLFYDGPFWLDIFKNESMELKIECINGRLGRKIEFTFYCEYYELLKELYNAFKTFGKILYKNKMYLGNFHSVYQQTILSINELKEILN